MGWNEKIGNLDNLFLFCKDWKSRKDIADRFKLSDMESWHACKALKNYTYFIQVETAQGKTARSYMFKLREFEFRNIREAINSKEKYVCSNCGSINLKDRKCSMCNLTTL